MENFKLIEDECKTNGFTQYLNNMIEKAVSQIITSDGQDPYWIDVSRQILKTLILIDLSSKNVEVDIPNILVNARNKIEEGLKNPTICNFIDYKGINTIIQNEKIFESTMKIIKNDLEVYLNYSLVPFVVLYQQVLHFHLYSSQEYLLEE